MSDSGYFGVMTSTSTQNMSMSQYFFILSYCKRSEEHFGTKISASSQTIDGYISLDAISCVKISVYGIFLKNFIVFNHCLYSTSTRPGEGAIYRYLSRRGKIAGVIQETKSSGLSLS